MEPFQIDEEMVSFLLNDLDIEDLKSYAEVQEQGEDLDNKQIEMHIFTLFQCFRRTRDINYLEQATIRAEGWVAIATEGDPEKARRMEIFNLLTAASAAMLTAGEASGPTTPPPEQDLEGLGAPSGGVAIAWAILMQRTVNLVQTAEEEVGIQHLNELISLWEALIITMDRGDTMRWLGADVSLEQCLDLRLKIMETETDLDRGLEVTQVIVNLMPPTSPGTVIRASWWSWAVWVERKYRKTPSNELLERHIGICRKILVLSSPEAPGDLADALHRLARILVERHEVVGSREDLEEAISHSHRAIEVLHDGHPSKVDCIDTLCTARFKRYELTADSKDLDFAIETLRKALTDTADSDSDARVGLRRMILANALTRRCDRMEFEDDSDFKEAHDLFQKGTCDPLNERIQPDNLKSFSILLGRRFQQKGEQDDINNAIDYAHQAVLLTPENHKERPSFINTLSMWLHVRFDATGSLRDLEDAIAFAEQAVKACVPSTYHKIQAICAENLASCLHSHIKRHGYDDEMSLKAMESMKRAIGFLPPGDVERAGNMHSLGNLLTTLYLRTGNLAFLNEAIQTLHDGLDELPGMDSHPMTHLLLFALGTGIGLKFEETRERTDLDQAVDIVSEALRRLPSSHPDRALCLRNLARFLAARYRSTPNTPARKTGAPADWHDNDTGTSRSYRLPDGIRSQFHSIPLIEDLERCISACIEGWGCRNARPGVRIGLAMSAADELASIGDWARASELLRGAVELLPAVSPQTLMNSDKQSMLAEFAGLASSAAAAALNAGEGPIHALGLLEQGRGIIANLLLETRSDMTALREKHSDLAGEFVRLVDELDSPTTSSSNGSLDPVTNRMPYESNKTAAQNREIAEVRSKKLWDNEKRLQQLLQEIRSLGFLLPPSVEDMVAATDPDPIVVVNATQHRCDAFLIQRKGPRDTSSDNGDGVESGVRLLPLPELKLEDVRRNAQLLRKATTTGCPADVEQVLGWLWRVAAGPILDALGFRASAADSLSHDGANDCPRVWWVPAGILSQLPWHAAGDHRSVGAADTVIDRVMSSYTSSIKALIHGRQRTVSGTINQAKDKNDSESGIQGTETLEQQERRDALLVAMPTTPGLGEAGDIPWAAKEISMLRQLCPDLGLHPLEPSRPVLRDDILTQIRRCEIFHFAGHGSADPVVPSNSRLLLDDWQSKPLSVDHLRELKLHENNRPPFLGYLSACSTGANAVEALVDESIHLISACQLAGFRHVIGTLWEVSDQQSRDVAETFYRALRIGDDATVYRALHGAVRESRRQDMTRALRYRSDWEVDGVLGSTSEGIMEVEDDGDSEEGRILLEVQQHEARSIAIPQSEGIVPDHQDQNVILLDSTKGAITAAELRNFTLKRKKIKVQMSFSWVPYVHYGV